MDVKTIAPTKPCDTTTSGIRLSFNKKLLWAIGLWYPRNVSVGQYRKYWCFSWFMALGTLGLLLTEIVTIFIYIDDTRIVLSIFCPALATLGSFFKSVYIIYKKYEIQDLVDKLEGSTFTYNHQRGDAQQKIIRKTCQLSKIISVIFESLCLSVVSLWIIGPAFFEDPASPSTRPLPLPTLLPWDLETPVGYGAAYIIQIITCYSSTSTIGAVDTLCVSLLIHVGGQLESLAITIINLTETVNKEFEKINENVNSRGQDEDRMKEFTEMESIAYEQLIECIKHHQTIFGFAQQIQDLFSPVMLFQCATSTLTLCFVAFLLTQSSGDTGYLIKSIGYLIAGTFELWIYCVYGDRVIDLSTHISDAAYGCEWMRASKRFKKAIKTIIMRAQKPIIFKGGFLYVMSLETFASVVNASYSYFTILRQTK